MQNIQADFDIGFIMFTIHAIHLCKKFKMNRFVWGQLNMAHMRHVILHLQSANVIIHLEVIHMTTIEMEKQFERYLESTEYDDAEGMLLSMIRKAYLAGWNAAMLAQVRNEQPPV